MNRLPPLSNTLPFLPSCCFWIKYFSYVYFSFPPKFKLPEELLAIALWHSGQDPVHSAYSVWLRLFISCLPFLVGLQFTRTQCFWIGITCLSLDAHLCSSVMTAWEKSTGLHGTQGKECLGSIQSLVRLAKQRAQLWRIRSEKEKTKHLSLKTFLGKVGTHQGGGGDELGASVHFQGMKGYGRKAAITEAAV